MLLRSIAAKTKVVDKHAIYARLEQASRDTGREGAIIMDRGKRRPSACVGGVAPRSLLGFESRWK